jgi:hypothetical protein
MPEAQAVSEEVEDRGDTPQQEEKEVVEQKQEAEPEAQAETEVEAASGQTVPLARFRAQNVRLKETQAELDKLRDELKEIQEQQRKVVEASQTPARQEDRNFEKEIESLESDLEKAYKDNDAEAIMAATKQLRVVERELLKSELESVQAMSQQTAQQVADQAFEETLTLIETEFPELDPESDNADQPKIAAVQALLSAFEQQGMASDDALIQAVATIFPDSEVGKGFQGTQQQEAKPAEESTKRGLEDKLKAIKNTPPNLSEAEGEDSDKAGMSSELDTSKLSDEEYDKLPESTKRRLRGDTLVA